MYAMTQSPIDSRHLARLLALQVLYEADGSQHDPSTIVQAYANISLPSDDARAASYMALQSFYGDTVEWGEDDNMVLKDQDLLPPPDTYQLLVGLIQGVSEHLPVLDEIIRTYAPDYPLDQLAIIDRNVLRIALYEIFYGKTVPVKVIINEAVRLAKLYGAENASSFVNGVLGGVVDEREAIETEFNIPTTHDHHDHE
jgi:transcription antitermination protein NusB